MNPDCNNSNNKNNNNNHNNKNNAYIELVKTNPYLIFIIILVIYLYISI